MLPMSTDAHLECKQLMEQFDLSEKRIDMPIEVIMHFFHCQISRRVGKEKTPNQTYYADRFVSRAFHILYGIWSGTKDAAAGTD